MGSGARFAAFRASYSRNEQYVREVTYDEIDWSRDALTPGSA
jgi:hypothetical protein